MFDLVYADDVEVEGLRTAFPTAKIEDASDFIHDGRCSIDLEVAEEEYFYQLLELGLATVSLKFQMWMLTDTAACKALVERWECEAGARNAVSGV